MNAGVYETVMFAAAFLATSGWARIAAKTCYPTNSHFMKRELIFPVLMPLQLSVE